MTQCCRLNRAYLYTLLLILLTIVSGALLSVARADTVMNVVLSDNSRKTHAVADVNSITFETFDSYNLIYNDERNRSYGITVDGPDANNIYTLNIPASAPERVVWTLPLNATLSGCNYRLSFAYSASVPMGEAKVVFFDEQGAWYKNPESSIISSSSIEGTAYPGTPFIWYNNTGTEASTWKHCNFDLSAAIASVGWNQNGRSKEFLRLGFDFPAGAAPGDVIIRIKDLRLEPSDMQTATPADDGLAACVPLRLNTASLYDMTASETSGQWHLSTTGGSDPWICTEALSAALPPRARVLSFEYKASRTVRGMVAYFSPFSGDRNCSLPDLKESPDEWCTYSVALDDDINRLKWGAAGDVLRLDFGGNLAADIEIRNICLRTLSDDDRARIAEAAEQAAAITELDSRLAKYFHTTYSSEITLVEATDSRIRIKGTAPSDGGKYAIAEVAPYEDALLLKSFHKCVGSIKGEFSTTLPRITTLDGFTYDRLLSKFVIVRTDGTAGEQMVSACRYVDADCIDQSKAAGSVDLPDDIKKGGEAVVGKVYDAVEMGMKVTLVGIPVTAVMWSSKEKATAVGDEVIEHKYLGRNYYFSRGYFEDILDKHLLALQNAGIGVFTVITIRPESPSVQASYYNYDHDLGMLMQHPGYSGQGTFAMVNLSTPESVNYYAAALDFLASRYSDGTHGRIHRYVVHNEIDDPLNWNDCGILPQNVYMDQFVKSARMAHNIIRQYNSYAQILVPVTQQWTFTTTSPSRGMLFAVRDLFGLMNSFSAAEGDFHWGVGYHSYPQNFQSRTWEDKLATWSMNTDLLTFKNLEVLDRWAKMPENMYKGTDVRNIWLTENGSSTPTYSDTELREQAACAAYALKKVRNLSAIQTLIWHASTDNDVEGNLNLGLHYRENYTPDPWGRKPAWYVFRAFGTADENAVLDPYKSVVGISDWSEIMHQVVD